MNVDLAKSKPKDIVNEIVKHEQLVFDGQAEAERAYFRSQLENIKMGKTIAKLQRVIASQRIALLRERAGMVTSPMNTRDAQRALLNRLERRKRARERSKGTDALVMTITRRELSRG